MIGAAVAAHAGHHQRLQFGFEQIHAWGHSPVPRQWLHDRGKLREFGGRT
jgi:hypothetical protein